MKPMSDVFISYSKKDHEKAKILENVIEHRGWSAFYDREIEGGQEWDEVIETELMEAGVVVVLWSQHSVSSKWVRAEAAASEDKVVPVLLEEADIPLRFRLVQAIDLTDWDGGTEHEGIEALFRSIENFLDTEGPVYRTAKRDLETYIERVINVRIAWTDHIEIITTDKQAEDMINKMQGEYNNDVPELLKNFERLERDIEQAYDRAASDQFVEVRKKLRTVHNVRVAALNQVRECVNQIILKIEKDEIVSLDDYAACNKIRSKVVDELKLEIEDLRSTTYKFLDDLHDRRQG
jgi:sulfur transfer protein SufE